MNIPIGEIFNRYAQAILSLGFLFMISQWLLTTGCATVGAPTGGPKDTTAPKLVTTIPLDQSINYKGNQVTLVFDEYINTSKLKKELIITPYTENKFEIKTKGKEVSLIFEDTFLDSITYSFNFREGITDITEKNPSVNAKVVFSTGNFLDSMELSGVVYDPYLDKPISGAITLLYDIKDTLIFPDHHANYQIKTDKKGHYHFKNIKNGTYRLYALSGSKGKVNYKSRDQYVGFIDTVIQLDTIKIQDILCQTYIVDDLEIKKARSKKQYFIVETNRGIMQADIKSLTPDLSDSIYFSIKNEEITFYNTSLTKELDSCLVRLDLRDSLMNQLVDTVKINFKIPSQRSKIEFKLNTKNFNTKDNNPEKIHLSFNKPISNIITDSIIVMTERDTMIYSDMIRMIDFTTLSLDTITNRKVSYLLKRGSITSIEGDTLENSIVMVRPLESANYGVIGGQVISEHESYIVQLLDQKKNVLAEAYSPKKFRFDFIEPGIKTIRVLIDRDGNGKWDKGSFKELILPEPVYHFDQSIDLKANWEMTDYQIIVP